MELNARVFLNIHSISFVLAEATPVCKYFNAEMDFKSLEKTKAKLHITLIY